jgi:hypothetical protein
MSKLLRIAYCSRSLLTGSPADLESHTRIILATARTQNRKAHLTGAMTFNDNCFAQVLEGAPGDLLPLFERICRDARHEKVKVLVRAETANRMFPHWSMAYVEPASGGGRHPLAHFSFEAALTDGAAPEAEQLLEALRQLTRKMASPFPAKNQQHSLPN